MIELSTEVCGFYKIEATSRTGVRRTLADWFPNLITDNGLNLLGTSATWLTWCQVGSGSASPAFGDTTLASRVAGTNTRSLDTSGSQSSAPYYTWRRVTYRFAEGVAAGNLAEVGVGPATSGNLFSRALILDPGGTPTTISVAADESLDVTYEFRYYPPVADHEFSLTIAGVTHAVVSRASGVTGNDIVTGWNIALNGTDAALAVNAGSVTAFSGSIGEITGSPSGTGSNRSTIVNATYSAGSHHRDGTAVWALTAGNHVGGIGAIRVRHGIGTYQLGFTPNIMKNNTQVLSMTFRHSWARRP